MESPGRREEDERETRGRGKAYCDVEEVRWKEVKCCMNQTRSQVGYLCCPVSPSSQLSSEKERGDRQNTNATANQHYYIYYTLCSSTKAIIIMAQCIPADHTSCTHNTSPLPTPSSAESAVLTFCFRKYVHPLLTAQ